MKKIIFYIIVGIVAVISIGVVGYNAIFCRIDYTIPDNAIVFEVHVNDEYGVPSFFYNDEEYVFYGSIRTFTVINGRQIGKVIGYCNAFDFGSNKNDLVFRVNDSDDFLYRKSIDTIMTIPEFYIKADKIDKDIIIPKYIEKIDSIED